ncbi:RtcB family protein [Rhizosphaericola mali]|uniref:3'-phosphate/5'-hydroxy nucleic acid ligase n=1 Tax=Rhizosphaericola mali TaxID=2545455 RepID=A0A5P2G278_9BACT|nr:RtcB family protein [Rhizosphaericola mali]QES87940.1 RtcB family protein [Rhizosphaericola mali]
MGSIKPKKLSQIGFTDNTIKSQILGIISKNYKHSDDTTIENILKSILENPIKFQSNIIWKNVAKKLVGEEETKNFNDYKLEPQPLPYAIYGKKDIDTLAIQQMDTSMRLPISVKGALMPDAHAGYGLPIGGVLATKNVVIPYAVGLDIGCRMALTIIDANDRYLDQNHFSIKNAIKYNTHFGMNGTIGIRQEHPILEDPRFQNSDLLKKLFPKAVYQLGTSGSGNHFVEMGIVELEENNLLNLPANKYLALLSHSGSRALGANIAKHYTDIAMDICRLPKPAQPFAWLDLDSEPGQMYWTAMSLAGDYAKACHDRIHENILHELGLHSLAKIENHHNFAWKEKLENGEEIIIHRKGATPAHQGELGIIPSNMMEIAYIVSGKGNQDALNSASHGAGRWMSRQRTKESLTVSDLNKRLRQAYITLIGGSVEEHPFAYKNIQTVMEAQKSLVNIEGKFYPKIVKMNKE